MRSNLPFILGRVDSNLAESGTDIVLHWQTLTGGTVDPVTGATVGGVRTAQTETGVKAFLHFTISQNAQKIFNELEVGDCIVDLPPDTTIEGRDNLQFEINGERWVQKPIGERLGKSWDVVAQGQRTFRTLLLRKAT